MFWNNKKENNVTQEQTVIIESENIPEVPRLTWNELLDKHDELSEISQGLVNCSQDSYLDRLKKNGVTNLYESIKRRKFYVENNSKIISPEKLKEIIEEHGLVMGRLEDANFYIPERVLDSLDKFPKEYFEEYEEALNDMKILHNSKEDFEKIKSFLNFEIKDSILKRQLQIMHNDFLVSQGDLTLIKKIISKEVEMKRNLIHLEPR